MTAKGGWSCRMETEYKKERELMDMDNSVVSGGRYEGTKW